MFRRRVVTAGLATLLGSPVVVWAQAPAKPAAPEAPAPKKAPAKNGAKKKGGSKIPSLLGDDADAAPAAGADTPAADKPPEEATPAAAPAAEAGPMTPEAAAEAEKQKNAKRMTADDCVRVALGESGLIDEADAKVEEWRGRLAEVQANYYPKLMGRGFIAPMFRVSGLGQDPNEVLNYTNVRRDYTDWGPYFHLEATLAQPLYTFGRVSAGKKAAEHRMKVEAARARQTRNTVALEVRKFYYLHLYAKTMLPTLQSARKIVDGALEQAEKMYEQANGKVTQIDMQRLKYGSAELDRYLVEAEMGTALSLEALKQTMGVPPSTVLVLADDELPGIPSDELPGYEKLLEIAQAHRPEWDQVRDGKIAATELQKSEARSSYPVVFAAALITLDHTEMRPDIRNPYYFDPYNGIGGGIAVGVQFDVDIAKTMAKADTAAAMVKQVEGLEKFAATGIPMEVRKAHTDAVQAQRIAEFSNKSVLAGRKWMTFAGAAYSSGTGEARDVLEGLVAYIQARRTYFESLQKLHQAIAFITYATGRSGVEDSDPSKTDKPASAPKEKSAALGGVH